MFFTYKGRHYSIKHIVSFSELNKSEKSATCLKCKTHGQTQQSGYSFSIDFSNGIRLDVKTRNTYLEGYPEWQDDSALVQSIYLKLKNGF